MLERSLQQTTIRKFQDLRARDKTFVFRKRHGSPMGVAGDPDFYGVWNGLHWELELKQPGMSLTFLQRARGKEWFVGGAVMGLARSADDVNDFLKDLESIAKQQHGTRDTSLSVALIMARREIRNPIPETRDIDSKPEL